MSRKRKAKHQPGDIYFSKEMGCLVRINQFGEEEPWEPELYNPFPAPPPDPDNFVNFIGPAGARPACRDTVNFVNFT